MKSKKLAFFMSVCVALLMTLGASPSHAIQMKITSGYFKVGSDDPIPIAGYVDLFAPDSFSYFPTIKTDIYLDDFSSMYSILWEGGVASEESITELYYGPGAAGYDSNPGYGNGYLDYITEYYDADRRLVTVASWEAMQFDITFSNLPDIGSFSLSLSAAKPVPEPATFTLLGMGLLGVLGASRRRFKGK